MSEINKTKSPILDVRSYTDDDLALSFARVDSVKYPQNYAAIADEIERRRQSGERVPDLNDFNPKISETPGATTITYTGERLIIVNIFLAIWLAGWFAGETSALRTLLSQDQFNTMLGLWLLGWTAGGLIAFAIEVWLIFGRDLITITGTEVWTRGEVLGIRIYSRRFATADIQGLQFTFELRRRRGGTWRARVLRLVRGNQVSFPIYEEREQCTFGPALLKRIQECARRHGHEWPELKSDLGV